MTALRLTVPEQHAYTDPTVELDVVRLRGWLTSLPLMDVVETVRLVCNALDAMNEQQLDLQLRFHLLEAFRATTLRLFVTVDPVRLSQLSLSKSQRQQAIEGVEKLLLSLAGGYKFIVVTLHETRESGEADSLFNVAVYRSIDVLVYILLDCFRFYRAVQPRYFSELHQLYRLARYHGMLKQKIDNASGDSPGTAALYHAAMLASLVDPSRLAEGEIGLLFEVLSGHAARCRIIPGSCETGAQAGLYQIDLDGDAEPFACIEQGSFADLGEPYILDAREALESVRVQLGKIPEKVRMLSPEATLLRKLLPEAPVSRQRKEDRHSNQRWAQLLLGIEAIHVFLMQASRVEPTRCKILDGSENGMRLSWDTCSASDIAVGELLAIVGGQAGEQTLLLGMVRSVRVSREGAMEVGTSLLKGGVDAAYCHLHDDPEKVGSAALLMHSGNDSGDAATLITAKGVYEAGRQILVDVADRELRACAGRQVLESPVFDRFEFSVR